MTLPSFAYDDPAKNLDAKRAKEKRDAVFKAKQAERYRIYKSRRHRAQVKHLIKQGGMR